MNSISLSFGLFFLLVTNDSCVPSLWVSDLGEGGAPLVNLVPFEG